MSTQVPGTAPAVVIGGGIAGCSTLYHLSQLGWTDCVLVERDELTSGSTWHAAAQVTQFGGNQTMVALKQHSIALYQSLAADPEHPFSYHITGGMRTAYNQDQLDTYHHYVSQARGMGVDMEVIDAAEVGRRHPLLDTRGMLGAWWDPLDGYIDPAGITFALARKAREAGATVSRFNPVLDITRLPNAEFIVHTEHGDVHTPCVVNACGYRVNEVGRMLGVTHPVVSMEHMYFLTETIPAIEALDHQVPIIRDPQDDFYSRQEKQGLLVGVYEQGCKTFGVDGIDPDFTQALCPSDLDRCLDNMERIFERMPALADTGIRSVINGPITYTIDGLPLVGPVPGVPGYFACTGLRAGIGEGGGHGKILAELMVHGESEWDAWCLDPRRFTSWANLEQTRLKAIEDYQNEFHYHLPHEHRPAGRQARTTPLYDRLGSRHAIWGVVNGWERALCFGDDEHGNDPHIGFRHDDAHQRRIAGEVSAVQNGVGLMEVSGFTRIDVRGAGASAMLDHLVCGNLPAADGKVSLCYLLNPHGHVLAEATVARLANDHFWYGSAAAAEWHDLDWLNAHRPADVTLTELTNSHTILVVAGPNARTLMSRVSPHQTWGAAEFPWMRCRSALVGHATVMAMSVSFSGEQAFELHVPTQAALSVFDTLEAAGEDLELELFGLEATESMRMEKGYCHWKAELLTERHPMETGLERFVRMDKSNFIGKQALQRHLEHPLEVQRVLLELDSNAAPAQSGASLYVNDAIVGTVTSGSYGHRVQKNLAQAYVAQAHTGIGTTLQLDLLDQTVNARVVELCQYDPQNTKVRL